MVPKCTTGIANRGIREHPPIHTASLIGDTGAVSFGFGVLAAVLLLVLPGAVVARAARLGWPAAVAVGPALTYGTVELVIIPFGALGIRWNAWTALAWWWSPRWRPVCQSCSPGSVTPPPRSAQWRAGPPWPSPPASSWGRC